MFKPRTIVAVSLLSAAVGIGGTVAAQATVFTNTSTSVNTLISAKCYHHKGNSVTTFHWSSKLARYVAESPHHSTSSYDTCHK